MNVSSWVTMHWWNLISVDWNLDRYSLRHLVSVDWNLDRYSLRHLVGDVFHRLWLRD